MFEVSRDAVIWIMSLVLDRRPHDGEAFRLLFLITFSVLAAVLILYWKDFAYRSSAIRHRLLREERYAGRYLQALWRNGEVRYSFVNIFYNARRRRYEVAGRTYSPTGEELTNFNSTYVLFPSRKNATIEFLWRAKPSSQGYTRMTLEDFGESYIQGDGLVITFGAWPRAYPVRFKHLHDHHVREALGVRSPANSSEEPEFVRKFHAVFGARVMEGFGGGVKAITKAEAQQGSLVTQGLRG